MRSFTRIAALDALIAIVAVAGALVPGTTRAAGDFVGLDEARSLAADPAVRFVFADARTAFEEGHIPGSVAAYARDLHYLDDVRACRGLPMCESHAGELIGGTLGIGRRTRVVVYDSGSGVNASGVWFFLELYGVEDIRILDGGLATWKAHGGAIEPGPGSKPAPVPFTPAVRWEMVANLQDVKEAVADPARYIVLDARDTLEEYTGQTRRRALVSPGTEEKVKRGGAIPGAVFSPWSNFAGNEGGVPDRPTLKDAAVLAKQVAKLGKDGWTREKAVISYCHVGLGRGSFEYLALKHAGVERVRVYVGSWDEWGNDPSLPLAPLP